MARNYARFVVSIEILRQMLDLPDDVAILATRIQPSMPGEDLEIWVESERFPEVHEGNVVPQITPVFERVGPADTRLCLESLVVKEDGNG